MMKRMRFMMMAGLAAFLLGISSAGFAGVTTEGLILHLDAAEQVKSGGMGKENAIWKNLANQPDSIAGSAVLHNFKFDKRSSGWIGSGTSMDPYALRFDAKETYAVGPGNLEIPEITIEAWGCVNGFSLRGATLIGDDFGAGGISLLISNQSPILLNGATFTPIDGSVPFGEWHQVTITVTNDTARLYIDGAAVSTTRIDRKPQENHYPGYNVGAARHEKNDFAEADGLNGMLSIVRVYNRILTRTEVQDNFDADRGRFGLSRQSPLMKPVSSMPIPSVKGLDSAPIRCMKWDYYYHPVVVPSGYPYGARQAFDGYPANPKQPIARNYWRADVPTSGKPASVTINYKQPVAVTRYVHYYDRSGNPRAWKDVDIYSSADGENWKLAQSFVSLKPDYPQYLGIDKPELAKYYKIEVKSLVDGAANLGSLEIETYYGATIGNVTISSQDAVQSEPCKLSVKTVNPDASLKGTVVYVTAPQDGVASGKAFATISSSAKPGNSTSVFNLVPGGSGRIPLVFELRSGTHIIDKRTYTLYVEPKLVFQNVTPEGAVTTKADSSISCKGRLMNNGSTPAMNVKVSWMGQNVVSLGNIPAGKSVDFTLKAKAAPGFNRGVIIASADGFTQTSINKSVICPTASAFTVPVGKTRSDWKAVDGGVSVKIQPVGAKSAVTGTLQLMTGGKSSALIPVGDGFQNELVSVVPGGVFHIVFAQNKQGDIKLQCRAVPDDPNVLAPKWVDVDLRLAVDKPKIMFRPHIDWYPADKPANCPQLTNGHNSATRMITIQTSDATISMVPDTDNLMWGFTPDNQMTANFRIPLEGSGLSDQGAWRPIDESPREFTISLPVKKGDWWDAYRYVVTKLFDFEQPKQWAMPLTQMQMLNARYVMRYEVWSEKWQTVRSHPWFDFFYNFYGTTYTLPSLYSWYLATDDQTAKVKAEKVADWLINMQEKDGPSAGGWFSMYCVENSPPELVGRDQAWNRWIMPHAAGTSAKTLEWYWVASGKRDGRAFNAAKLGCDYLIAAQRPDGGWPYAIDLNGKPITELADAGQIWCTWALWKMWEYTGETKYKEAALKSKDFFKKTFMDIHRYMGYWEDVSGAAGSVNRSWEGYEPAIAALVFADMGEKELALDSAKDAATWTWTRVTSTRQYETCYGMTTEQSLCGPSQAQTPMVGIGLERIYQITGDTLWQDFAGGMKAINFCADPEQAYGMVAVGGWDDPLTAVIGTPYEGVRPCITPNNSKGDEYGRQVWNEWCTAQFAWLGLEWLIREANTRAPEYINIDPDTYRGKVLGAEGRVKMPEEKCDVTGIDHYDVNWTGYQNDLKYVLLVMNHKEKVTVAIRPHEAHLDVYNREPQIMVGIGKGGYKEAKVVKKGVQYMVEIPRNGNAILIWDRIK